ncbi:PDF receptor-like [Lytechinus pictus]|uniref:PDF receptor-like n=1 Tax=Lytechinus pictus TaxID=7653 RepID=UPI0030B9D89D
MLTEERYPNAFAPSGNKNKALTLGALFLLIGPVYCQTDPAAATPLASGDQNQTGSASGTTTPSPAVQSSPQPTKSSTNESLPVESGDGNATSTVSPTPSDSNTTKPNTTAKMEMTYLVRRPTTQPPTDAPHTPSENPLDEPESQLLNASTFELAVKQVAESEGYNYSSPVDQCILRKILEPIYFDFEAENGTYCPSYYDEIQCWKASPPGLVEMQCPQFFNGIFYNTNDTVTRLCLFNGSWGNDNKSDYSECKAVTDFDDSNPHEKAADILIYTGYSLSFTTLLGAFVILVYFKSLRCVRNYIHLNLVTSFLLLYLIFFLMIIISTFSEVAERAWYCRLQATAVFYINLTSFFWMFVEGLYLHTMVVRALTVRREKFWVYCLIGWGLPVIFSAAYGITVTILASGSETECFQNSNAEYIIRVPIIIVILVNVCFMVHIMVILVTKLRASHSFETQQYRKGVRGIVVLLPLLGASYFMLLLEPSPEKPNASTYVYRYLNAFLQSTQGFFVAIIYVYMNQEVQNVIKRLLRRWREENTLPSQRNISRRGSHSRQNSLANNLSHFRRGSNEDTCATVKTTIHSKHDGGDHVGNGKVPSYVGVGRREELVPLKPVHEGSNEKLPDWPASDSPATILEKETTALTTGEVLLDEKVNGFEPENERVEEDEENGFRSGENSITDDQPVGVGSDEALIVHGNTPVMEQNLFLQDKLTRENNNLQRNGTKANGSDENQLAGQVGALNASKENVQGSVPAEGNQNNSNNTQLPCILKAPNERHCSAGKKHVAFVCPDITGDVPPHQQFFEDSESDSSFIANQYIELSPQSAAYTCSTIASDPWTREGDRSKWSPKILFKRPIFHGSPASQRLVRPSSGDQGRNGRIKLPKSPAGTPV